MHPPLPGDKAAGFVGLIAGTIAIFLVVYATVLLTNRAFEGHTGATPNTSPTSGAAAPAKH
jgi:hypothetical protein